MGGRRSNSPGAGRDGEGLRARLGLLRRGCGRPALLGRRRDHPRQCGKPQTRLAILHPRSRDQGRGRLSRLVRGHADPRRRQALCLLALQRSERARSGHGARDLALRPQGRFQPSLSERTRLPQHRLLARPFAHEGAVRHASFHGDERPPVDRDRCREGCAVRRLRRSRNHPHDAVSEDDLSDRSAEHVGAGRHAWRRHRGLVRRRQRPRGRAARHRACVRRRHRASRAGRSIPFRAVRPRPMPQAGRAKARA